MWLTIWINGGPEKLTGSETATDLLYYMTDHRLENIPLGAGTYTLQHRGERSDSGDCGISHSYSCVCFRGVSHSYRCMLQGIESFIPVYVSGD